MKGVVALALLGLAATASAASVAVARPIDFKANCDLAPDGGCQCKVVENAEEVTHFFSTTDPCKVGSVEMKTVENKIKLGEEIAQKFGAFKENCFPKPSGGCKCNEGDNVVAYNDDKDCKEAAVVANKAAVNAEINAKFGQFKENCFPKPSGGCKCNVGDEVVSHDNVEECKEGGQDPAVLAAKAAVHNELVNRAGNFKEGCFAKPSGGCKCTVGDAEVVHDNVEDCREPVRDAAAVAAKANLNAQIKEKFGDFKEGCFAKPSGGCKCTVGEAVFDHDNIEDCKMSVEDKTKALKVQLGEEIKAKFGGFKENCFPKPSGGCRCNEKDAEGNEVTATYDDVAQCNAGSAVRAKRDVDVGSRRSSDVDMSSRRSSMADRERPSQNVRDPVRERAQANYAAVLDELKNKFRGLKEGCFPRPKGCLCIIGKTPEGRDITERRMKDVDCKCQPGETGPACPAA